MPWPVLAITRRSGPEAARLGTKQGYRQRHDRHAGDGYGDQQQVPGPGMSRTSRAGQPAKLPDQGAEDQDRDSRVRAALEERAAQRRERDGRPVPGKLSSLPGQPRIGVLDVVSRRHQCCVTPDSRASAAAASPMTAMVTARIQGSRERRSGSPRGSARWVPFHSRELITATAEPRRISGVPMMCRPQGTPGKGGSNWTMASPAATRASAVRLQARKVRSLAKLTRASGSASSADSAGLAESRWWLVSVLRSSPAPAACTGQASTPPGLASYP